MRNKKAQALIEALLVGTISISLFAGTIRIGLKMLNDELKERKETDSRLSRNSGFMLVSLLIQLPILLFLLQAVFAFHVFNVTTDKSLADCFDTAMNRLIGLPGEGASLHVQIGALNFKSIREVDEDSKNRKIFLLQNSLEGPGNLKTFNLQSNYKCGAEVLCFKDLCRYKISADKY